MAIALSPVATPTRAETSVSGVYQEIASGTCGYKATSCTVTLPALPAANAVAMHTASCSISLDYDASFITLPLSFVSLKVGSNRPDAGIFLAPQQIGFYSTGSNNQGQVDGVFSLVANYSGVSYFTAGATPVVTLTFDPVQADSLTTGTIRCTLSGLLVKP